MLKSLIICFSTYSRIPMPQVEWEDKNMRWAICFFPLIGMVIGVVVVAWVSLADGLAVPAVLKGAVAAAIPILLTGGIHLDGFCDVSDALASHQSKERRLEIMKDPTIGAFAAIYCEVWLLLFFAGWCCVGIQGALAASFGFVLSRALSGLALVRWHQARNKGMLRSVADAAHKNTVTVIMAVYIVVCLVVLVLLNGWLSLAPISGCGLAFLYYRWMSYRQFGGITGDLAGWFVCVAELVSVLLVVMLTIILEVIL